MWRHHTPSIGRVHSILIARGLRLVLVLRGLHHVILIHYRARREVWIAIVVWSPTVPLLLRDSAHSLHRVDFIILVLILVSMRRIIII
jgi:hypothetical protein